MYGPSFAKFGLVLRGFPGKVRNVNEVIASRPFDSPAGEWFVVRQMLLAAGTLKF